MNFLLKLVDGQKRTYILLLIAAVGVLAFLLVSSTFPLKDRFLGELYPKAPSQAQTINFIDMAFPCGFTNPAFCDDFSQGPAPVKGRGNDLDFKRWSFNRGQNDLWATIPIVEHCLDRPTNVNAPNDSFFCGSEVPEPEHWMEAMADSGVPGNDARPRQLFDFTNRTGMIQYGVDAKTAGGHSWWLETWITDTPLPDTHAIEVNTFSNMPRNGIGLEFTGTGSEVCPNVPRPADYFVSGSGAVGIVDTKIVRDYQIFHTPSNELGFNHCVRTQDDRSNMIQIRLSTTRIEVYASDAGSNVIRRIFTAAIDPPLNFSVGYVHFVHAEYGPEKAGVRTFQTYHWHDMGFDGPIHPNPRAYEIPDPLTFASGGRHLQYIVRADGTISDQGWPSPRIFPAFTFNNVDLTGATSANVNFNTFGWYPTSHMTYQWNNGPVRIYDYPGPAHPLEWGVQPQIPPGSFAHSLSIPLADLVQGTNTLRLGIVGTTFYNVVPNTVQVSNIELEVNPPDSSTPAPAAGMVPCLQFQLLMGVMPTMLMGADPCSGMPAPTRMPLPTSGQATPTSAVPTLAGLPTATPTPRPTPTPTPVGPTLAGPTPTLAPFVTPSPTPPPTATPTPVPGAVQTITFDDRTLQSTLGEYPKGVINWGNNWFVARPTNQFTTPNLHMGSAIGTSRSFTFVTPRKLLRLDMINHGSTASTVALSCDNQPQRQVVVDPGEIQVGVATNWTQTCTTVTITSSSGWVVHYDNLVIQ